MKKRVSKSETIATQTARDVAHHGSTQLMQRRNLLEFRLRQNEQLQNDLRAQVITARRVQRELEARVVGITRVLESRRVL